jgi:hypothetical protein
MKTLSNFLTALAEAVRQSDAAQDHAESLSAQSALDGAHLEELQANGTDADSGKLAELSAKVQAAPKRFEAAQADAHHKFQWAVGLAREALAALVPWINAEETRLTREVVDFLKPYVINADESRAVAENLSAIHHMNFLSRNLAQGLDVHATTGDTVERILGLLKEATSSESASNTGADDSTRQPRTVAANAPQPALMES